MTLKSKVTYISALIIFVGITLPHPLCHAQEKPESKHDMQEIIRTVKGKSGKEYLTLIRPALRKSSLPYLKKIKGDDLCSSVCLGGISTRIRNPKIYAKLNGQIADYLERMAKYRKKFQLLQKKAFGSDKKNGLAMKWPKPKPLPSMCGNVPGIMSASDYRIFLGNVDFIFDDKSLLGPDLEKLSQELMLFMPYTQITKHEEDEAFLFDRASSVIPDKTTESRILYEKTLLNVANDAKRKEQVRTVAIRKIVESCDLPTAHRCIVKLASKKEQNDYVKRSCLWALGILMKKYESEKKYTEFLNDSIDVIESIHNSETRRFLKKQCIEILANIQTDDKKTKEKINRIIN